MANTFTQQRKAMAEKKIRLLCENLPESAGEFLDTLAAENKQPLTRLQYAYDLRLFFHFLVTEQKKFAGRKESEITEEDLNAITARDINRYMASLAKDDFVPPDFHFDEKQHSPRKPKAESPTTRSRRLASLKSYFKFLYRSDYIAQNITEKVKSPKINDHEIVFMESDQITTMIGNADTGRGLTEKQNSYGQNTDLHLKERDVAIIMLMLGTGIRASELLGLDVEDIDLEKRSIHIIRKGGKEASLFFNRDVGEALDDYLYCREQWVKEGKVPEEEHAAFLSSRKTRLSARALHNIVAKYDPTKITSGGTSAKGKITPHKLRASYATNLYWTSNDIKLVADTLGHSNLNIANKYYAQSKKDDEKLRASEATEQFIDRKKEY